MRKLVTVLMIVLPLLFLVAVFAITGAAAIGVDIHANKLVITNKGANGIFHLDISGYDERPLYLDDLGVEVRPVKAKDKTFKTVITDAEGNPTDIVGLSDDGKFLLEGVGVAKITCTSTDGGYSDSVLFNVTSSGALELGVQVTDAFSGEVELLKNADGVYYASVPAGTYFVSGIVYPAGVAGASVEYSSSDDDAAFVNGVSGEILARFSGKTTITLSVDGARGRITETLILNVEKPDSVVVNGSKNLTIAVPKDSDKTVLYVEMPSAESYPSADDVGFFGTGVENFETESLGGGKYKITVYLSDDTGEDDLDCQLALGSVVKNATLSFSEYVFELSSSLPVSPSGEIAALYGTPLTLSIAAKPYNKNILYRAELTDDSLAEISVLDGYLTVRALKIGVATLIVTPYVLTESGEKTYPAVERNIFVTPHYTSLIFEESASTYGLKGNLAVASMRFDGDAAVQQPYKTGLVAKAKNYDEADFADLTFTSSNSAIASVSPLGLMDVKATGNVTITVKWKYGDLFGLKPVSYVYTAVDGVWAETYEDLMNASKKRLKTVLKNDVDVGKKLFDGTGKALYDDATMQAILESETSLLPTTADWTYYKNRGLARPNVRYAVEFTNDVFGNGYTLSADNITNMTDSTGNLRRYALFRGPLNFVAVSHNEMGASVKAQDNVVFLVRTNGVVIDNVTLLGCNDETLEDGSGLNLTLLNNVGTTLEIMSDATLTDSYVRNGRTVVRAFGRYGVNPDDSVNVEQEKINVKIEGCLLQNAREFILKIGTNRAVRATDYSSFDKTFAPRLTNASGEAYTAANSPLCDEYLSDDYFVNTYVLTDVVLKDSVLKNSGLFTIGMESHFAGGMLVGETFKQFDGWKNLAATSYPAVLHMVGNVVLDDWKPLSNVDSSTLIETNNNLAAETSFLNLNIRAMLESLKKSDEKYKNIIAERSDGQKYVHGGIAFYGGGYNYSMVDFSEYTFEQMKQYTINLSVLNRPDNDQSLQQQGQMLPYAAGGEDFRFIMFDATSAYGNGGAGQN